MKHAGSRPNPFCEAVSGPRDYFVTLPSPYATFEGQNQHTPDIGHSHGTLVRSAPAGALLEADNSGYSA